MRDWTPLALSPVPSTAPDRTPLLRLRPLLYWSLPTAPDNFDKIVNGAKHVLIEFYAVSRAWGGAR